MTKRIAFFAHYDAQNEVKQYVSFHLKKLRELCDNIVFISTSKLSQQEIEKVSGYCSRVELVEENSGYDFSMWKRALQITDTTGYDELVLTNSSVFGPIYPLKNVFTTMEGKDCDYWGMTDSTDYTWHIQSYFLVFKSNVFNSESFKKFWDCVLPYKKKFNVIASYELGLSNWLFENGFKPGSFINMTGGPVNPKTVRNLTCYQPMLTMKHGMPYVKVELLRDNPVNINILEVYELIRSSGWNMGLIKFDRPSRLKK